MPTGTKIRTFVDLLNRPVYREILHLLETYESGTRTWKCTPLSAGQIRVKLFPLQSQHVNFYSSEDEPLYTDGKYYKTMTVRTLNTYLKNLVKCGLLKRLPDKQRAFYRTLTEAEYHELQDSAPLPDFDNLLNHISREGRKKALQNMLRTNDILAKDPNYTPPYTTEAYKRHMHKIFKKELNQIKSHVEDYLDTIGEEKTVEIKIICGNGKA